MVDLRSPASGASPLPDRLARWAAGGLGGITLLSSCVVAFAHLRDRQQIDHVAGAWIGLAKYLTSGLLYPELYDGTAYGGTRFMPLYFSLHSLMSRVFDDYVVAGKALSFVVVIGLIGLAYAVLRRLGVPASFSLLLASLILLTGPGIDAATGIRADALAALLGLGALSLIERDPSRMAIPAAALAALALFTKLSALWAPAAIVIWLVIRGRRHVGTFVTAYVGSVLLLGITVQLISDGRFLDNIGTLAFGGVEGAFAAEHATLYTLALALTEAPAMWALAPFVLTSWIVAVRVREVTIYHIAWAASVLILIVVMTDRGTGPNQLLEPIVLSIVLIGASWNPARREGSSFAVLLAVAMLWSAGTVFALHLRARVGEVVLPIARGNDYPRPTLDTLNARLGEARPILSEDASIPVARDELPTVLDPWTFRYLADDHPDWADRLAARIRDAEFPYIVLLYRFETKDPDSTGWYGAHFGSTVMSAIDDRYTYLGSFDGYHVYGPEQVPADD
jgi:hypothetical protein